MRGSEYMYRNLYAEMVRQGITRKQIAIFLGVRDATIYDKLNGKYDFRLGEAFKIQHAFFPNLTIEYLFEKRSDDN